MSLFKKKPKKEHHQSFDHSNNVDKVIDPKKADDQGFFTACSSEQLLDIHNHVISVIDSNTRLSKMHFDMYYRKTIANYAALVQAFPASEYHHHSYPTGLLEHSLDVARAAVVYARKYLYTETGIESEMEEMLDIFTYACFTAALLHDAGKVVTDLDVVYYNDKNQVCAWLPFGKPQLKDGTRYKWRYNSVRNKLAHESAAPTLVQTIVPFEGIYWIRSRTPRLWQEWLHTIAGRSQFGGDVGKVIERCDSYSVQKSMHGNSSKDGLNTNTRHTLSERFVIAFRQLIESGQLPLNRKGAGAWVKDGFVYLVSQRTVEAAIPLVKSAGGTGIPSNDVTIFSLLCDGGVAIRHEVTNDVVHAMNITLNDDDWSGELTFLKVAIDTLDPNGTLGLIESNITLTDKTSVSGFNAKREAKNNAKNDANSNSDNSTNEDNQRDNYQSLTSDLMSNAFSSFDSKENKPEPIDDVTNTTTSAMANSLDEMFGDRGKRKFKRDKVEPKSQPGTSKTDSNFNALLGVENKESKPAPAVEPQKTKVDKAEPDFAALLGVENKESKPAPAIEPQKAKVDKAEPDFAALLGAEKTESKPAPAVEPQKAKVDKAEPDFAALLGAEKKISAIDTSGSNLDEIQALFSSSKTLTHTTTDQSADIDKLFLANNSSSELNNCKRTSFTQQSELLVKWIDDGIASGTIRYNKLSSKSNYCYNTKNGWFVCLWSAITRYNEQHPNAEIKLDRTERIIAELKNARLVHLDNKSNACREAVLRKNDSAKTITLRGVYFKRDSLKKCAEKDKHVNTALFTIMP